MHFLIKKFGKAESGSLAVNFALASVALVGAAGLGLDTYRLQNAATALDHAVKLTCDRFSNADLALYTSTEQRIKMGEEFGNNEIARSSLDASRTKLTLTKADDKVNIAAETELDATFMKVLGYSALHHESTLPCDMPSTEPPKTSCSPDDLVYMNPGTFQTAAGTLISGTRNYTATLYNQTGKILKRQIIGNGSGETEAFLKSTQFTDLVVVQPFHNDGTVPAPCNPTIKPPDPEICSIDKALELGKTFYQSSMRYDPTSWTRSQLLGQFMKPGKIDYAYSPEIRQYLDPHSLTTLGRVLSRPISINTATGFQPDYLYPLVPDYTRDPTVEYLSQTSNDINWYNARMLLGKAKLYRIISGSGAVWENNGQCIFVTSPIVLDLPGLGHIQTTGVSSAYYAVPQHPVYAKVKFAYGSTGKQFDTEWITSNGQALLVDNRDGKAATDMNGSRLFGNMGGEPNGYAKLAKLDANGDKRISDAERDGLMVWIDNGDAVVQPGELQSLADVGVTEMSTQMNKVPTGDGGVHMRSSAVFKGKLIMTEDVWFGIDLTERGGKYAEVAK